MNVPVCDEMKKLRDYLNAHKIVWQDVSDEGINGHWICRTHFYIGVNFYSVINGFYTYGGFNDIYNKVNQGRLELYGTEFNEPIGYLLADEVIRVLEERNPWLRKEKDA